MPPCSTRNTDRPPAPGHGYRGPSCERATDGRYFTRCGPGVRPPVCIRNNRAALRPPLAVRHAPPSPRPQGPPRPPPPPRPCVAAARRERGSPRQLHRNPPGPQARNEPNELLPDPDSQPSPGHGPDRPAPRPLQVPNVPDVRARTLASGRSPRRRGHLHHRQPEAHHPHRPIDFGASEHPNRPPSPVVPPPPPPEGLDGSRTRGRERHRSHLQPPDPDVAPAPPRRGRCRVLPPARTLELLGRRHRRKPDRRYPGRSLPPGPRVLRGQVRRQEPASRHHPGPPRR